MVSASFAIAEACQSSATNHLQNRINGKRQRYQPSHRCAPPNTKHLCLLQTLDDVQPPIDQ